MWIEILVLNTQINYYYHPDNGYTSPEYTEIGLQYPDKSRSQPTSDLLENLRLSDKFCSNPPSEES